MKRSFPLVLGLALIWPAAASAQDMGWSTIIPSVTGTDVLGLHLREQVQRQQAPRRDTRALASQRQLLAAGPSGGPTAVAPADLRALRYTPSKARRSANLARFVEKSRAADPAGAQDLQRLFASGDFIEKIGGALAPHGMHVDNVADAYTVWWVNAWQATRGHNDATSRTTNEAVRGQAARALSASPEFVRASDADKQEFAESLLVQAALIDTAIEQAKGDPKRLREIGAAVNQGAKGMGIDLSTMVLTDQGFVPARGSGASPAPKVPTEAPVEAAAASSGGAGLYAPIAIAALGAGVGGLIWWGRGRG